MWADGWDSSLLFAAHQTLSLSFSLHVVQSQSAELPATTEGKWRRRLSSQGHKTGPLIVRLTSHHHVLSQGGFQCVF